LRSRFDTLARLVATVGSRSNSVFSEAFDELTDELRPALGMAFSLNGDTVTLLAEHRLGSVVPMPWRQFKASDPLALPLLGALRSRRLVQVQLGTTEGAAAFEAWGPLLARDAEVALVLPAVHGADVLAFAVFFFNERSIAPDEGVQQFLLTASALLGLALALQAEREREATRSAELAETTRLATLGTLSATVAHELRGPAGALALLVPELQQTLGAAGLLRSEALEPLLNDMRTCVERISGLCRQLGNLNYHDEAPETFDLKAVANEVVALARVHAQGAGVTASEELGQASIVGHRDQIGQVILNLTLNAIDACRETPADANKRVVVSTALVDGAAVIEVADSGPGLPESAVERIFQPFYTTKPRGKGTGLGLSVSRDIVRSHRGHIEVGRSRLGGALFRVVLPALDTEAVSRGRSLPSTPRPPLVSTHDSPRPPFASTHDSHRSPLSSASGMARAPLGPSSDRTRLPQVLPPDRPSAHVRFGSSPEPLPPARARFGSSPEPLPPARARFGSSPDAPPPPRAPLGSSPEAPPPSRAPLGSSPDAPPPSRGRLGSSPDPAAPPRPQSPATMPRLPAAARLSPLPGSRSTFAGVPSEAALVPLPPRPRLGSAPEPPSATARPRAPAPPVSQPMSGPLTPLRVLFVDDDALLLRTMKRVMGGCEVSLASTIDQARATLEAGAPFDVVVTDVNMPGGSGLDLHRRLVLERPALAHKLIFLSGGALTPGDADYLRSSGCVCLPKPIAPDALLEAVRSVARPGKPSPVEGSLTLRPALARPRSLL
jgi:signal transduction histidine kinase/ActR/RegA family two-component response regulator